VRLVKSGWSSKAMPGRIMLSLASQKSSRSSESFKADPENRLWGRMNRRRLEVEAIRDALFAVAGRLDPRPGGPADADPASSSRRMLYIKTSRTTRAGLGPLFDAADPAMHADRRTVSPGAPQAPVAL